MQPCPHCATDLEKHRDGPALITWDCPNCPDLHAIELPIPFVGGDRRVQ